MTYIVTLHESLKADPKAAEIAQSIAVFEASGRIHYPKFFGHYGGFENQPNADNLHKLHLAGIHGLTSTNWKSSRGYQRTSDHFAVYCEHWLNHKWLQLLAIVTPDAHQRIDKLLPALIEQTEIFNALSEPQIKQLTHYTAC